MKKKLVMLSITLLALVAIISIPLFVGAQQSNFGSISLVTGFTPDPYMANGTSGGGMSASSMGPGCSGWITPQPDHIFYANSAFNWLRIFVRASGDTTLIVRGPGPMGMVRCNDDTFGTNPAIDGPVVQGMYSIWVGSYAQGQNIAYQLGITELSSVTP